MPKSLLKQLVSGSSLIPTQLFGQIPEVLVTFGPKIDADNDPSATILNPVVADMVKAINIEVNMFPESWGPIIFVRPFLELPGSNGPKVYKDCVLSGKSTEKLKAFKERLSLIDQ